MGVELLHGVLPLLLLEALVGIVLDFPAQLGDVCLVRCVFPWVGVLSAQSADVVDDGVVLRVHLLAVVEVALPVFVPQS